MIAERQTGRTVKSTLQGAVVKMGIDENAMAHIMNVLTDLYSNPLLAIIREYSTNAWDAHVEAGVTRAIEVSIPSALSPFLRIKDFGVGLNAEDIRTIYSQYGNSTKRATNDQVGMLGLGCKSALTYTDNFVVVSCKDGERIETSIERDEDGTGVMKLPTVEPTDLPNGTEVIIPIKSGDTSKANQVARDFFRFWTPGTVLVNGAAPARIEGLDLHGDGKLLVIDGDTDYVVMGNVAYPVQEPLEIRHGLPNRWGNKLSVAAFVGIGEVNFPPSRETLMGTPKTRATLKRLGQEVKSGIQAAVQREVQTAPTPAEAIRTYVKWEDKLGRSLVSVSLTYKGRPMPTSYTPNIKFTATGRGKWQRDESTGMLVTQNASYDLSRADRQDTLTAHDWAGTLFLHGYDLKAVSPTQKRKMRKYVEDNGLQNVKRFCLIAENPSTEMRAWLGDENVKPWADVHAIKLPTQGAKAQSVYGRLPGSYDFYNENGYNSGVSGDKIDQSKPIFYVHGRSGVAAAFQNIFKRNYPNGYYIVALGANRIEKFCRIIPTAKTAAEGVKALWAIESAKFTADELLSFHMNDEGARDTLAKLDADKVNDPDLKEAIRVAKVPIKTLIDTRREYANVVHETSLTTQAWTNPLSKYPLWGALVYGISYRSRSLKLTHPDVYLYLNTKYEDLSGKGRQVA